jgi:hypothetical protein
MCEASRRVANSGRSQRLRCNTLPLNTLPLFTELPRRGVPGSSPRLRGKAKPPAYPPKAPKYVLEALSFLYN